MGEHLASLSRMILNYALIIRSNLTNALWSVALFNQPSQSYREPAARHDVAHLLIDTGVSHKHAVVCDSISINKHFLLRFTPDSVIQHG